MPRLKSGSATLSDSSDDGVLDVNVVGGADITFDVNAGVEIKNGTTDDRAVVSTAGADAESNTANKLQVTSWLKAFNGTTWDRLRSTLAALHVINRPSQVGSANQPSSYTYFGDGWGELKASPGNLLAFRVTNSNAAVRYIQFHDTVTDLAGSETPSFEFLIPGGTVAQPAVFSMNQDDLAGAPYFSTGITFAFSTTNDTYTAATGSDHTFDFRWI